MTKTEDGMVVSCDTCRARYRLPRTAVGTEGCKVRCPSCAGMLVVFPAPHGRVPIDLEPPTVDVPLTPIATLPPGSQPPRRDPDPTDAPDPWRASTLSVTPPPPRRHQGHGAFSTTPVSTPRLPHPDAVPVRMSPPPRTATAAPPRTRSARPPAARTDAPPVRRRTAPPQLTATPAPRPPRTEPMAPSRPVSTEPERSPRSHVPASPRSVTEPAAPRRGFAVHTHPGAVNRTGSTGGGVPSRATPAPASAPLSYAPPWSQGPGMGAQPTSWTHPGVMTPPPGWVPTATPAPVHTAWEPVRPSAVVALDRVTVFGFLGLSAVIGILCFLVGISWDRLSSPPPTPGAVYEVRAEPALQVLPPSGPRWRPEPRLPRLQARPAAQPVVERAAPAPRPLPKPTFSVESSDVRDPWADE